MVSVVICGAYNALYFRIMHYIAHNALYCACMHVCACACRFVGWITNFIRQRHQAAASCAYSYARLTFVRRMPPQIRNRVQKRQKKHDMNTTMRGYLAPYTPFTGRGSGKLFVKPTNWRNTCPLTDGDRDRLRRYTLYTNIHTT